MHACKYIQNGNLLPTQSKSGLTYGLATTMRGDYTSQYKSTRSDQHLKKQLCFIAIEISPPPANLLCIVNNPILHLVSCIRFVCPGKKYLWY